MPELLEYKCPHCGGAIQFDSSTQKMKCPYCDSEFDVESLKKLDQELKNEEPDEISWKETTNDQDSDSDGEKSSDSLRSYVCNSCGGEIICDATTAATSCPFCGNPVVMMGQFKGAKRPNLIIPFKLDKESAKKNLKEHLKGKTLLPKLFKDENHIDEIKGIYVPFWLFDAKTKASCRYNGTKVRIWSDQRFNYTETNYYKVVRGGDIGFSNVPVDGSSKMPDELMESIEPYDYSEAVDFQTAYLSGYMADKYDVLNEDLVDRVNTRIKETTEEAFRSTVSGYDTLSTASSTIKTTDGKAKYALLPVWLLNTSFNGSSYSFAMNGQSGKFVGDLPMDKGLYYKYFALIAALSMIIFYLLISLIHYGLIDEEVYGGEPLSFIYLPASLLFGVLTAFLMTGTMKSQLKSVAFKANASDYVRAGSMKLTEENDMFIYRQLTKTPRADIKDNDHKGSGGLPGAGFKGSRGGFTRTGFRGGRGGFTRTGFNGGRGGFSRKF